MSSIAPYPLRAALFHQPEARTGSAQLSAAVFWGLAAVLVAAVVAPLFLVDIVPLTDFPAHLARVTLLSQLPLDPTLARYWSVDLRFLPNLAMDAFVPMVAKIVGAKLAMKIFVASGPALWVTGAALIYRGLWREWSAQALFSVFFAINASFIYGFSNYHVAAGVALTAAGCWLMLDRRPLWLVPVMAVVALALLVSHLLSVAVLGLLLGGFELGRLWKERAGLRDYAVAAARLAAIFLPAALAWALLFEHGKETGVEFKFLHNLLGTLIYSSNAGAIRYNAAPALVLFGALAWAWRAGRLQIAEAAIPAVVIMAVASLLCPAVAMSGAIIHVRLPAIVCILLLTGARISIDPRWLRPAMAAMAAAAIVSGALEWRQWRAGAAEIAAIRAAAATHIEPGARVATALATLKDETFGHAVDLTVLDRKVFVPSFFTTQGQSTIVVNDAYKRIAAGDTIEGAFPTFAEVAPMLGAHRIDLTPLQLRSLRPYRDLGCDFDYLYVIGRLPPETPLPPSLQTLVDEDSFTLFRIAPPKERGCAARG